MSNYRCGGYSPCREEAPLEHENASWKQNALQRGWLSLMKKAALQLCTWYRTKRNGTERLLTRNETANDNCVLRNETSRYWKRFLMHTVHDRLRLLSIRCYTHCIDELPPTRKHIWLTTSTHHVTIKRAIFVGHTGLLSSDFCLFSYSL